MSDWQYIRPRTDIDMTVQELDQLILDILEVRTQYLLLQDAAKIDRCRMLLSVAKSITSSAGTSAIFI
jgi:hypothetical protein